MFVEFKDVSKVTSKELLKKLEDDKIYPAHIRVSENGFEVQTVEEHCKSTAKYAFEALKHTSLKWCAYLAGYLHDIGKYTNKYRSYIVAATFNELVVRGSVNHTFAGVRYVMENGHNESRIITEKIASEHIAFAIGSHHGLFDLIDENGDLGFEKRLNDNDEVIEEALKYFTSKNDETFSAYISKCSDEISNTYNLLENKKEQHFFSNLVSRLVLSAVIEGDRKDTAEFLSNQRNTLPSLSACIDDGLFNLEKKLSSFSSNTKIEKGRQYFSECCKEAAQLSCDLFALNLPTGAGKTLSSLRFALHHAKIHNKNHIYYAIPLISIIEQNSDVIKQTLGKDFAVLEHHSNVVQSDETNELDMRELSAESWDSPAIITTTVQLLNTFFSYKTTCIRRFHSLCNSVLIIDEVQTIPIRHLAMFLQTIEFLKSVCKTTVLFCSATQPAYEFAEHSLSTQPRQIVNYNKELWDVFKRTNIINKGTMNLESVTLFAKDLIEEKNSILIICNKRAEAAFLFENLKATQAEIFHISASMCIAHRRKVLERMEQAKKNQKVICISSQVLEMGVDISFACVIRFQCGLDSIVQSAGRCNRNGESDSPENVYVIRCAGETLQHLKDIEYGKQSTSELFALYKADYSAEEAVKKYYELYSHKFKPGYQCYYCEKVSDTLYSLLSDNTKFKNYSSKKTIPYFLNQAQKTAGINYKVFDDNTTDVIVPYEEAKDIIKELCSKRAEYDFKYLKELLDKLKPYTISIYHYQKDHLNIIKLNCGVLILSDECYDKSIGIVLNKKNEFLEV